MLAVRIIKVAVADGKDQRVFLPKGFVTADGPPFRFKIRRKRIETGLFEGIAVNLYFF